MFNLLCERADNVHGGRLRRTMYGGAVGREQPTRDRCPSSFSWSRIIRSPVRSLPAVFQQLAQCKAIYDKHAETILGNMGQCSSRWPRSQHYQGNLRELAGKSHNQYADRQPLPWPVGKLQPNTTQRLGRELMTPAELATMPGDKCILQLRGLPPFFSPKHDLKRHPNYRYTAEADKQKNAFDLDRLITAAGGPG